MQAIILLHVEGRDWMDEEFRLIGNEYTKKLSFFVCRKHYIFVLKIGNNCQYDGLHRGRKMNNSGLVSKLELYRKFSLSIHEIGALQRIRNWFKEDPEDSWEIWHIGNI